MYAGANMGHPSREEGFVLCSNFCAADGINQYKSYLGPRGTYFNGFLHFNPPAVLADRSQQAGMAFHDGQELCRVR